MENDIYKKSLYNTHAHDAESIGGPQYPLFMDEVELNKVIINLICILEETGLLNEDFIADVFKDTGKSPAYSRKFSYEVV